MCSTTSNTGKVHRVHFHCRAPLPRGCTLHVCLLKDADKSTNLVEMVTTPKEYPMWRTRRPVVVTDVSGAEAVMTSLTNPSVNHNNSSSSSGLNVAYRYCSVSYNTSADGAGDTVVHTSESTNSMSSFAVSLHDITNLDGIHQNGVVIQVEDPWQKERIRNSSAHSVVSSHSFGNLVIEATSEEGAAGAGIQMQSSQFQKMAQLPFRSRKILSLSTVDNQADADVIDVWNNSTDATFEPYLKSQEDVAAAEDPSSRTERLDESSEKGSTLLYLVCFHLPISVSIEEGSSESGAPLWSVTWNESLLAKTTERSEDMLEMYDVHWIGTASLPEKPGGQGAPYTKEELAPLHALLKEMNCTALFLPDDIKKAHYYGMCKQVLWPAFHNIDLLDLSEAGFDKIMLEHTDGAIVSDWDQSRLDQWWGAYKKVNRIFCDKVCELVKKPNSIIWVHDYHLSLLPKYIHTSEIVQYGARRSKMVFFLHIPFPTSQIFRELECGEAILDGMLHSSVIGFHAFDHARHFLHSAKRIMGCDYDTLVGGLIGVQVDGGKRTVVVDISNVSIEPDSTSAALDNPSVHEFAEDMKTKHSHRRLIAGVDVAQRLSGVALKLLAFERLLADYPVWQNKVTMIQKMLIPGSRRSDEIATLKQVRGLVNRIRNNFGHHVIEYSEHTGGLPIQERLGLWLSCSVFMNTCVREGLNLYPLEYIFARKEPAEAGVVIASEFSAVCSILNGALRVNPFDVQMTASSIDKALTMSHAERLGRRHRDIGFVSSCPSAEWTKNVLRDLDEVTAMNTERDSMTSKTISPDVAICPPADPISIAAAYEATKKRVIILDFNGTLVRKEPTGKYLKREILGTTGQKPPSTVIQALKNLTTDPKNTVFVVSGDTQENLEGALGSISGLGLAASNGACFAWPTTPGKAHEWYNFEFGDDWASVKQVALPILSKYTARTNGSTIKLSDASIGWSYYSCDPEWGSLQAAHLLVELQHQLAAFDVRFVTLKGVVEVVPRMMHKGVVVKKILREVASRNNGAGVDFILCIGDDVSDEKMFTTVYSFKSEENDDYINVTPSPAVKPKSPGITVSDPRVMNEVKSLKYQISGETEYAFTITVGKKASSSSSSTTTYTTGTTANQYVNDATDVEDILVTISGGDVTKRSMSWDLNENGGIEFFS